MRKYTIAGNWKMNAPDVTKFCAVLTENGAVATENVSIIIAPPFPYLYQMARGLSSLGAFASAQDVSAHESGAYTGEVSASMIEDNGARYTIIGHSERRQYHFESDEQILAKVRASLAHDLFPILCVGESLEERESEKTRDKIKRQLSAVFDHLSTSEYTRVTVAYEPIWAIGTGRTATPNDAEEICSLINSITARPTLYGGSMNEKNARDLLLQPHIDGGLIGGASLDPMKFSEIINIAKELSL